MTKKANKVIAILCSMLYNLPMTEKWKKIKETNGFYEVSSHGRIRRAKPGKHYWDTYVGKILKPTKLKNGYEFIVLEVNGVRYGRSVHVLVANAFLGKRPKGKNVNHKDENKSNNMVNNLEWVTQKENYGAYLKNHPNFSRGENHHLNKIPKEAIPIIKNTPKYHGICADFARQFGVTKEAIYLIRKGKNWKHV